MTAVEERAAAPPVCVVVVRWNAAEETARCLASLQAVRYPNLTICLVDNASTDGAAGRLATAFPAVTTVTLPENLGYAGGCNAGIAWARRAGATYVLLLNNDTVVDPDVFTALVHRAEALARPVILTPKILFMDRPDHIWSAGSRLDRRRPPGLHIGMDDDEHQHNVPAEVDWATGCALFFPLSVVDRIGPMDERYFLYLEDVDWCLRARKHGVPVWYVPEARLWHEVSTTVNTLARGSLRYYVYRNTYLLVFRHFGALARARWTADLAWTLLRAGGRTLWSPSHRHDPYYHARTVALLDFVRRRFGRCRWLDAGSNRSPHATAHEGAAG